MGRHFCNQERQEGISLFINCTLCIIIIILQCRVIASRDEQEQILMACHKESGHFGISKTLQKIRETFYWKGMTSDVKELVNYNYIIIIIT